MKYLIDGYNLMFRSLHAGKDLQQQREELIDHINSMVKVCNMRVTMVFDGAHQPGEITRTHYDSLEIIYTEATQTADDYLVHLTKKSTQPHQITVVTSDNKLAWRIRRQGGKTESIDSFMRMLHRRVRNVKRREQEPIPFQEIKNQPEKPKEKRREITLKSGYEDYLEEFEKRFEKLEKDEGAKKPKSHYKYLTDHERWLDLFEKKSQETHEDDLSNE